MIARHWKGISKPERSDDYINHLKNDTFKILEEISGFLSAKILSRKINGGIEFLIITEWENIEAIQKFAGKDFEVAVVPDLVKEIMLSYDTCVSHFEINYSTIQE